MRYSQPLSWARSRSLFGLFCGEERKKREEGGRGEREGRRFFLFFFFDDAPLPSQVDLHRATRLRSRVSSCSSFAPQRRILRYICRTTENKKTQGTRTRGKAAFEAPVCIQRAEQRPGCTAARREVGQDAGLPSAPFPPSFPRCLSKTNETYPSGEQWCVWRQLMHETRSPEEDDDEEPLPLRPGFVAFVVDDADDNVDLGALLLLSSLPPAPSSRSRYVSATAPMYHSSVATTSSRKARARTRFLLSFCCCRCACFFFEEGEDGSDAAAADEENAAAFSWSGCLLLQPPPPAAALASVEEEVLIGGRPPFPPLIVRELIEREEEKDRESEREREQGCSPQE